MLRMKLTLNILLLLYTIQSTVAFDDHHNRAGFIYCIAYFNLQFENKLFNMDIKSTIADIEKQCKG